MTHISKGRFLYCILFLEPNFSYYLFAASEDEELHSALKINLYAALHTALLLLPESFSEEELYLALAGISYTGQLIIQNISHHPQLKLSFA